MTEWQKVAKQIASDICKDNKICTCNEKDGHCISVMTIAERLANQGYKPPRASKEIGEVKHGTWLITDTFDHHKTPIYRCSICNKEVADHYIELHKHCLHCGARMDEKLRNNV